MKCAIPLLALLMLIGGGCGGMTARQETAQQEAIIKKEAAEKALNKRVIREAEAALGLGASAKEIGELAALKKADAEKKAKEAEASPAEKAGEADRKAKEEKALREAEAAEERAHPSGSSDMHTNGASKIHTTTEATSASVLSCGDIPKSVPVHLALNHVSTVGLSCAQARLYAVRLYHCTGHTCNVDGYRFSCRNLGEGERVDERCVARSVVVRFETGV